jgi:NTP pyrophosphatase (non-canonical NTP hydrolase)
MSDKKENYWYPLWKLMYEEFGVHVLVSECAEIAEAVDKCRKRDEE